MNNNLNQSKTTAAPLKKRRFVWIIIGSIVLLVLFAFIAFRLGFLGSIFRDKNIVAKVGVHNITKQEVQKTVEDVPKAGFYPESQETMRKLIMDYWLYTLIAKEYGIEVSDQEALDYLKVQVSSIKPSPSLDINNSYVRYRAYKDYLQFKLVTVINSPQSGSYILAHFDQNLARDTLKLKALTNDQYQAVLKADRAYATDFINTVYTKLKTGTITFEQGMELQLNDKVIGSKALSTATQSMNFGQSNPNSSTGSVSPISGNPQLQAKIRQLKAGEMSEPFIIKAQAGPEESADLVDILWVIIKVDTVNSKGPSFDNPDAAIQNFKDKYGYEVFN